MPKPDYDPLTMVVREIEEVIAELSKVIIPKLPGGPPLAATWTTVCEGARIIHFAKAVLAEKDEDPGKGLSVRAFEYHGQIHAVTTILRRVADEMGVSNFKLREVPVEPETLPGDKPRGHLGAGDEAPPG